MTESNENHLFYHTKLHFALNGTNWESLLFLLFSRFVILFRSDASDVFLWQLFFSRENFLLENQPHAAGASWPEDFSQSEHTVLPAPRGPLGPLSVPVPSADH